jgi:PilZ domain
MAAPGSLWMRRGESIRAFTGGEEMGIEGDGRRYPKAKIKWLVSIMTPKGKIEGITLDVSPTGAFISCATPLGLNQVFELMIEVPELKRPLKAKAEVVWSNKYGPDDEVSPRGMGARFVEIGGEDRKFIAKVVMEHYKGLKVEPRFMENLQTLIIDTKK